MYQWDRVIAEQVVFFIKKNLFLIRYKNVVHQRSKRLACSNFREYFSYKVRYIPPKDKIILHTLAVLLIKQSRTKYFLFLKLRIGFTCVKGLTFKGKCINAITSIERLRLYLWNISVSHLKKSKITKILNSEKNSKCKIPNQMTKSNDKTHQTNGQLSYFWLGIRNFQVIIIIIEHVKTKCSETKKRMENSCHIPDLVQAFSYVENISIE